MVNINLRSFRAPVVSTKAPSTSLGVNSGPRVWREPDRVIWERRAPPRHFPFSQILTWVPFDRGAKS